MKNLFSFLVIAMSAMSANSASFVGSTAGTTAGTTLIAVSGIVTTEEARVRREQIVANAEQIAVLNQAYTVQMTELLRAARMDLAKEIGAEAVSKLTDQEVVRLTIEVINRTSQN